MKMHPSEDELVLLFYGDADAAEEARLTEHLDGCLTCQPAWQELRATLNAVDAASTPEPPADFERVMWARVQRALEDMPAPQTAWWSPRFWMPAAVLAGLFVAIFTAGQYFPVTETVTPAASASATSQPERALLVAMDDHLERSELLLVELMNAPETDAVRLGFGRETADDLLSSSRLYRQTATHTGNVQLATMLEDLEQVLLEIARSPGEWNRKDLDALRTRIEQEDLIFKVRVVTDDIRERQKTISLNTEGDL
jgi:hypothetical protein